MRATWLPPLQTVYQDQWFEDCRQTIWAVVGTRPKVAEQDSVVTRAVLHFRKPRVHYLFTASTRRHLVYKL